MNKKIKYRDGFSLLEILLALAILGGGLAVLSRIVDTGMIAARESRDLSAARMLCQTKMAEILLETQTGMSPQSVPSAEFETLFDSESSSVFQYSVEVLPAPLDFCQLESRYSHWITISVRLERATH